ncbi:WecB/TagA/CpsF family glycosyltransferase [Shewanella aegiceratis]|uniref:WecB/TagA/CpsF family glycosyltransferase n=1 Tax=Shewanella aegiceratis TaxID=2864203 RepID=UPI0021AC1FDC|nr:WecB/TagA/CpsF family glycosyltransferase [Shewanella aegiceratis]
MGNEMRAAQSVTTSSIANVDTNATKAAKVTEASLASKPASLPTMVRAIDLMLLMLILPIWAPLLLAAISYCRLFRGQALETIYFFDGQSRVRPLYRLYQGSYLAALPSIWNLIRGDVSLIGDRLQLALTQAPDAPSRPGLINFEQLYLRMGLSFESPEAAIDGAFISPQGYLLALVRALTMTLLAPSLPGSRHSLSLFGLKIANLSMNQLLERMLAACEQQGAMERYCFVNADCMNISRDNKAYHHNLTQADLILADGLGLRLASRLKGTPLGDNLNGTDMFPLLCERLAKSGHAIYLLGGRPGIAQLTADKMQARYPALNIAGTHHGYLDSELETAKVIAQINASKASILLVAMGAPQQELWLAKHQAQLNVAVGIGVGGLFDFYSERIIRAPLWVRQIGMEWIARLLAEPARMWRRYLLGNPRFLYHVLIETISNKLRRAPHSSQTQARAQAGQAALARQISTPRLDGRTQGAQLKRSAHALRLSLNRISKRLLDILGAGILLVLLTPLLLLAALLIRLESPGAILYSQQRAGLNNKPFTMWKFRSMYQDAEARLAALKASNEMDGGVLFKMKRDPRITGIGKLIRKASIDELPQLWNVLKGEMSLVGPRPALPSEVSQYSLSDRRRLSVKPGITCIWQVSGRSDIPFDKQVLLDVDYIYQQSLWADIRLLLKTIPAVLFARGAY